MLQVTEQTPSRIVVKDQRRTAGIIAAVFTVMSIVSIIMLLTQGIESLILTEGRDYLGFRLFGLGLFLAFGVGFVFLGMTAYQQFMQGATLVLDRDAEQMHLQRVDFLRPRDFIHPIYSVSHIEVKTDDRMRVYAIYVALLSGERIALGTISTVDEEQMKLVVGAVRAFLRAG